MPWCRLRAEAAVLGAAEGAAAAVGLMSLNADDAELEGFA